MAVYIYNILSLPIYSAVLKSRKRFIILASFQMFLILALRNTQLGVDLGNYSGGFRYIGGLQFGEMLSRLHFFRTAELVYPYDYESGYVVLNWAVSHLGFGFHGFLVVCAAVNMAAAGYFIYRFSKIPWLSFMIFCSLDLYTYMFGILRQSLALSLFMFAVALAMDRKYLKAASMLILAFTFHRAVFVVLPLMFFLNKEELNKKRYSGMLVGWFVIVLLSTALYERFVLPIMAFLRKLYVGHEMRWNNMVILLALVVLATILFCNFSKAMNERIYILSAWAVLFGLYFDTLGMHNDVLARASHFLTVFMAILIPHVLEEYHDRRIIFGIKGVMIILLCGYMIYSLHDDTVLVPYRTIWSR